MDLIDLSFRLEKEFEIEVSVDDFHELVSKGDINAGDLHEMVLAKLHLRDVGRYDIRLNTFLWEEMKRVLQSVSLLGDGEILLSTPLADLFPKKTRRPQWSDLRSGCRWRVQELDYPASVGIIGLAIAIAVAAIEQFQLWQIPGAVLFWPILGAIGLWMLIETYAKIMSVCAPLRTRFPSGIDTVKDLCRAVLAHNYAEVIESAKLSIDTQSVEIWNRMRKVLIDSLGVDEEEITFKAGLRRDLGFE